MTDQRRVEFIPAPPITTRLRVSGIPPMSERLGFGKDRWALEAAGKNALLSQGYGALSGATAPPPALPVIHITPGSGLADPLDQAPLFIRPTLGDYVFLAARTWAARLAIWYLRRYVRACMKGKS